MFITVRKFSNVKSQDEVIKKIQGALVPTLSTYPGFINYYATKFEDGDLGSVSMFATKSEADKASEATISWLNKNLSTHLPNDPMIIRGEVLFNAASKAASANA